MFWICLPSCGRESKLATLDHEMSNINKQGNKCTNVACLIEVQLKINVSKYVDQIFVYVFL